ncbi:MAG TPA: hypothetical protein VLB83_04760 [Candidatus Paceibacterota bacterium]|nr:hypothetical protein [Candidatus Paceibacterota bacterium]
MDIPSDFSKQPRTLRMSDTRAAELDRPRYALLFDATAKIAEPHILEVIKTIEISDDESMEFLGTPLPPLTKRGMAKLAHDLSAEFSRVFWGMMLRYMREHMDLSGQFSLTKLPSTDVEWGDNAQTGLTDFPAIAVQFGLPLSALTSILHQTLSVVAKNAPNENGMVLLPLGIKLALAEIHSLSPSASSR